MFRFRSGSKIVITGGSFTQNNDVTNELKPLYDKVAPNAILNAGGRADPVRCHPGTREEVIAKIEKWMMVTHAKGQGIFWLSGPAGAGKSAIIQTIAERCIERPVVATLLFQLFDLFPVLRAHVAAIATRNPVIFRQSMQEQFLKLVETPLLALKPTPENPLVILIDGLDEYNSENSREDQISLLYILHDIATRSISPAFIVLVASRTESHLTMAFNRIGCHPDSIYLDKSYRPSDDIRVFLIEEFSMIKRTHSLRDTLPTDWPPSTDIDAIIEKSSGQFVYAATVKRFISNSAASPKRSLEIVMGLRPVTRTSPFATLDSLYTLILSQADDWSAVQDILAAEKLLSLWGSSSMDLATLLKPLGYTKDDILSSLSDLTSIIRFRTQDKHLTVYHASLNDFLYDEQRADHLYIDVNAFSCRLAPAHFKQMTDEHALHWSLQILDTVTEPNKQLTTFMKSFLPDHELFRHQAMTLNQRPYMKAVLQKLYQSRDAELYENILNRWQEWLSVENHLSQRSANGNVTGIQENSLRPSTPPSGCFPITLWRNRNFKTKPK